MYLDSSVKIKHAFILLRTCSYWNSASLFVSETFPCTGYLVQRFRFHRHNEVVPCRPYSSEEENILYWSHMWKFSYTLSFTNTWRFWTHQWTLMHMHEGEVTEWVGGPRQAWTWNPSTSAQTPTHTAPISNWKARTWFCKGCFCVVPFAGWTNISQTKLALASALTQARTKSLQQLLLGSVPNRPEALVRPARTHVGKNGERDTCRGLTHLFKHWHANKHKTDYRQTLWAHSLRISQRVN